MPKIDITKTELVWPGKYNEDGTLKEVPRVNLPFQVIETVNESRAKREANKQPRQGSLFDVYEGTEGDTFEEGWKNKLIWGDNLLVMGSLLEKFAGKIDLIYIDPPFATGADFSFTAEVGDSGQEILKEQSLIEEKAYRDTWGEHGEKYTSWLASRLNILRELLSDRGSIYIHCDWRVAGWVRLMLDEIFGSTQFVNEIAWCYEDIGGKAVSYFKRKHVYRPRFIGQIKRTKLKPPLAGQGVVSPEPEARSPIAQSTSAGCRERETPPMPGPVPVGTGSGGPTAVAP